MQISLHASHACMYMHLTWCHIPGMRLLSKGCCHCQHAGIKMQLKLDATLLALLCLNRGSSYTLHACTLAAVTQCHAVCSPLFLVIDVPVVRNSAV